MGSRCSKAVYVRSRRTQIKFADSVDTSIIEHMFYDRGILELPLDWLRVTLFSIEIKLFEEGGMDVKDAVQRATEYIDFLLQVGNADAQNVEPLSSYDYAIEGVTYDEEAKT